MLRILAAPGDLVPIVEKVVEVKATADDALTKANAARSMILTDRPKLDAVTLTAAQAVEIHAEMQAAIDRLAEQVAALALTVWPPFGKPPPGRPSR